MNILLVEPDFPYPNKSKHKSNSIHKNFVPIGLLKLGAMHKAKGNKTKLIRGKKNKKEIGFYPDKILITSIFTYWSSYVWDNVKYYRQLFPNSEIWVGGIYVTLHAGTKKFEKMIKDYKVKFHIGIHNEAEKFLPDYSLLSDVKYHATHMMRGCIRRCKFCGVWRIEPKIMNKTRDQVIKELKKVRKNRVVFYDNNILANSNIKEILNSFVDLKINGKSVIFESQSGFDGRLLEKDPELVYLIKKSRFKNIRIAWDHSVKDKNSIKKQIDFLVKVGYHPKDITVFMIYNFDIPLGEMILKQKYCLKWGVQIADCRYRPLEFDYDNYKPSAWRKGQTPEDYYIHEKGGWTDEKIRIFRKIVRIHNIFIRYVKDKNPNFNSSFKKYMRIRSPKKALKFMEKEMGYRKIMEKWSAIHNTYKFFNLGRPEKIEIINKSSKYQKRIKKLNRLKKHFEKNNIFPLDFSDLKKRELDKKINNLIEKIEQ